MKTRLLLAAAIAAFSVQGVQAETSMPSMEQMWEIIQQQQQEIERLKTQAKASDSRIKETQVMVNATADVLETVSSGKGNSLAQWTEKTTVGGYGEHHYSHYDNSDDKVDAHRYVMFLSHQFNDKLKMFSEVELEHSIAGDGQPGEVELEQAYIQWDFAKNQSLLLGQYLIPVGIINETHEPDTFYGVERNAVEKNIIPATWWETGAMVQGEIMPGLSYNAALHSGLKTDAGGKIRSGRQKSAKATAEDLAMTLRVKYTGIAGLELAATVQHQTDITQGVAIDEASATLLEMHGIYQTGDFSIRALWAGWDVDGTDFAAVGRDEQHGWYLEPTYKVKDDLGVFMRYSEYNTQAGLSSSDDVEILDYGINYWIHPRVVLKADYSDVRSSGGNDSLNLGVGWSF